MGTGCTGRVHNDDYQHHIKLNLCEIKLFELGLGQGTLVSKGDFDNLEHVLAPKTKELPEKLRYRLPYIMDN